MSGHNVKYKIKVLISFIKSLDKTIKYIYIIIFIMKIFLLFKSISDLITNTHTSNKLR